MCAHVLSGPPNERSSATQHCGPRAVPGLGSANHVGRERERASGRHSRAAAAGSERQTLQLESPDTANSAGGCRSGARCIGRVLDRRVSAGRGRALLPVRPAKEIGARDPAFTRISRGFIGARPGSRFREPQPLHHRVPSGVWVHACVLSRARTPRLQESYVVSFSASRNAESVSRRTSWSPSNCLTLSCAAFQCGSARLSRARPALVSFQ
jgi:hypothetical protein